MPEERGSPSPPTTTEPGTPRPAGDDPPEDGGPKLASAKDAIKAFRSRAPAGADDLDRGDRILRDYVSGAAPSIAFEGGAKIAGDVIIGWKREDWADADTDTGPAVLEIGASDLADLELVFEPPAWFDDAHEALAVRRILILQGPDGQGKFTTALRVVGGHRHKAVWRIDAAATAAQLRAFGPERGAGYVINSLGPETAAALDKFLLDQLDRRLEEAGCRLVIITPQRAALPRESASGYMLRCTGSPDPAGVLERHLKFHLKGTPDMSSAVAGLMSDGRVRAVLDYRREPRVVAALAERLAELLRDGKGDDDAIARELQRFEDVSAQVSEWFREKRELDDYTFMVAVAVLNGTTYQAVADAGDALLRRVQPDRDDKGARPGPPPPDVTRLFGRDRLERVKDACADLVPGLQEGEFGPIEVSDIVRLRNPAMQDGVLRYLWTNADGLRRPMLAWLRQLGRHPNLEVRTRAAGAVGLLSRNDLQYLVDEVISPWAGSQLETVRQCAVLALGVPAAEPKLATPVLTLLRRWADPEEHWWRQVTAAMAFGGPVGRLHVGVALDELYALVDEDDEERAWSLLPVLGSSLAYLVEHSRPDQVLRALSTWSGERKPAFRAVAALLLFLAVAMETEADAPAKDGRWPALLVGADDPGRQAVLTELWRRSLNEPAIQGFALDVLQSWLLKAVDDRRLETPLRTLLGNVAAASPRDARRLRHELHRMSLRKDRLRPIAERISRSLPTSEVRP